MRQSIHDELLEHPELSAEAETPLREDAETQIRRLSRRSFLWAGVAVVGGYTASQWSL